METTNPGVSVRKRKKMKRKKLPSLTTLKKKALRLWSQQVRMMHGDVCAICGQPHQKLNAHHIESKTNYIFRFDVLDGIALCPEHHVFGRNAVHKGIFFYEWLQEHRPQVIAYLRRRREETIKYDRDTLNEVIERLSSPPPEELYEIMGLTPPKDPLTEYILNETGLDGDNDEEVDDGDDPGDLFEDMKEEE